MRFHFDQSTGKTGLALIALLCLGAWLRLQGIWWDGLAGLHPDERHMLFVTRDIIAALADPARSGLSFADLWWSDASSLNPHAGTKFFVYGEAPLLAGVLAGLATGSTDWFEMMVLGRKMSAIVDTAAILAVFLGARLLAGNRAALAAGALFAVMPTVLQLSVFHAADVWLTAAVAFALVPMIALSTGRWNRVPPSALTPVAGAFMGLAMACKITGVLLAFPGLAAIVLARRHGLTAGRGWAALALGVLAAFMAFRLTNPFAFQGPGLLTLRLSPHWLEDFRALAAITASPDFPPNWQWIAGYGVLRFLRDFGVFGAGPVASALFLGLLWWHPARWGAAFVPLLALGAFLILTAVSQVSALRYAAPGLAPLAVALSPLLARLHTPVVLVSLALAAWWGSGVIWLHDGQHPRLIASRWLWSLPKGTVLTNESSWDDALPVVVAETDPAIGPWRWPGHDGWFTFLSLNLTAPESEAKARAMADTLARTDYLIVSSDRQSAVMPRLPERFPLTTAHYLALLAGEACFAPVLTVDRGYPLPGMRLEDSWVQEPWRVYDHPRVNVFARQGCFDADAYADYLTASLNRD